MNADRDRSEQPCTDTRCDAPIHPLDTEGALLPPITEPIALGDPESVALYAPESPAAPDTSTDTPETREGAREAHSDEFDTALRYEVIRADQWKDAALTAERALAVERARVTRVEALHVDDGSGYCYACPSLTLWPEECRTRAALAEPEERA